MRANAVREDTKAELEGCRMGTWLRMEALACIYPCWRHSCGAAVHMQHALTIFPPLLLPGFTSLRDTIALASESLC
jgi:hypothetical protein